MLEFFTLIFCDVPPPAVGGVSLDAILPLGALVFGVAFGIVQAYSMVRDKAYDIQYNALARRLNECEQYRDVERRERDGYRDELSEAHARIAELEARHERGEHSARPESR